MYVKSTKRSSAHPHVIIDISSCVFFSKLGTRICIHVVIYIYESLYASMFCLLSCVIFYIVLFSNLGYEK